MKFQLPYDPHTTEAYRYSTVHTLEDARDVITNIRVDLRACESCLAEAEREVERLRNVIRRLVSEWVPTDAIDDAQQLLNSEGRDGT